MKKATPNLPELGEAFCLQITRFLVVPLRQLYGAAVSILAPAKILLRCANSEATLGVSPVEPKGPTLMPISLSAYSELLESLHAAPLDGSSWELFLRRLCVHTDCVHGFFIAGDTQFGLKVLAFGGKAEYQTLQRIYNERYGRVDPWRESFLRNPRLGVIDGPELVSLADLHDMELYRELLGPNDLEHVTMLVLVASPRRHELISMWRSAKQGPMTEQSCELLRMLMPHLQIALQVRQMIGVLDRRVENAEAVLEASQSTSFVLDASGRVVHQSENARKMIAAEEGICLERGRLFPAELRLRAQFDALVLGCAHSGAGDAGGALSFPRRGGKRPLQVLIAPMRGGASSLLEGRVLVLVTDPETSPVHPDGVLRALYGLTPAETEVANGLLMGYSLEEIARLRRVSISTVRTQMKSLLEKTETRRQGELVRLLSTLPRAAMG